MQLKNILNTTFFICLFLLVQITLTPVNGSVFPDFPCSNWYDRRRQQVFPSALRYCQDGQRSMISNLFLAQSRRRNITDMKGCILWRLRAITQNDTGFYEFGEHEGLKKSILTVLGGLNAKDYTQQQNDERKALVDEMLKKSVPCKEIFNDVANKKSLQSAQWTPFYECVEKAWVKYYFCNS